MAVRVRNLRFVLLWIGIVGVFAVAWLSLTPNPHYPRVLDFWDKAQHALAYACLAICFGLALPRRATRFLVALGLIGFGGLIEVGQLYVPGRVAGLDDAVANGVGVVAGMAIALLTDRYGWRRHSMRA